MGSSVLSRADVLEVVAAAAAAPSVLNTQPWRFRAVGDPVHTVEVHLDPARRLPVLDPDDRSLHVSCGCAVLHLRLAVAALGRRPVTVLLPDAQRPTLLATVRAGDPDPTRPEDARLHAAIGERRSSRVPFVDEPLPPEFVVRLEGAAAVEGATLQVLDGYAAADVARLVHDADRAQRVDPLVRAEVAGWTRRGPDAVDGIPDASLGPLADDPSGLVRDFALGRTVPGRGRDTFEHDPVLAVLLTRRDGPRDWLVAGQALERVWLEATAAGVAMNLLTQPLELPELRWLVRPPEATGIHPQALVRLGYALAPTPPSPRRPLADQLEWGRGHRSSTDVLPVRLPDDGRS